MPEPGIPPAAPPPPPPTMGGMPAPGGPPAPVNLPTAEPEDMFAGVKEPNMASGAATAVPPIGEQASREGLGKKLLIIGGAVVLVIIVGIVVWLVFFRGGGEEAVTESSTAPATTITEEAAPAPAPSDLNPEFFAPTDGGLQASPEEGVGTVAPPVAPDTDGDGLTDAEEEQLGTNPQIADTDADGLSDRDEARAYRTDPLNKDTDGDSFPDGSEVQKGYNPKGSGLLFEVPPAG